MSAGISIPRRDFIRLAAGAGMLSFLPSSLMARQSGIQADPHFFLFIFIPGGMDPSYTFDARSLEMTSANLQQNYLNAEPKLWRGLNANTTLCSSLVAPLLPFQNDFTILNGVLMDLGVDAHEQQTNKLLTGGPFGGDCIVPIIGSASDKKTPIDALQKGQLYIESANMDRMVPLKPEAAYKLIRQFKAAKSDLFKRPSMNFMKSRLEVLSAQRENSFGNAVRLLGEGVEQAPEIINLIKKIRPELLLPRSHDQQDRTFLNLVTEMYRLGGTNAAVVNYDTHFALDCHDPAGAKNHPVVLKSCMQRVAETFSYLKSTPYDRKRSFWDVTTVMVASEFGRTMRQSGRSLDSTGTDHNAFANSILLGGKKIRGGQVIGNSDNQKPDERLSRAHERFDTKRIRAIGRPFNFESGLSRIDLPEEFDESGYLTMNSVINTLFSAFGVSNDLYLKVNGASSAKARVIKQILS